MEPEKKESEADQKQVNGQQIFKNILLIIIGLILGILIGLQFSRKLPEPWKPVLETSNFDYMDDVVNNALKQMNEVTNQSKNNRLNNITPAIQNVEQSLFKLKYFYLPVTEVRQLIYDADRLYYLGQKEEAIHKLTNARELLEATAESDILSLQKPLTEVVALIDELIVLLNNNSPKISEKFHEVGHRVNMMAYKGELIISGVKIPGVN